MPITYQPAAWRYVFNQAPAKRARGYSARHKTICSMHDTRLEARVGGAPMHEDQCVTTADQEHDMDALDYVSLTSLVRGARI